MQKDPTPYRLLLLEDNPGDLLLITDYLEEELAAPVIHQATSFAGGQAILEQEQNHIDLVFLDLSLPDKKGEELLKEMLALAGGIPIIVLTGYTDVKFAAKSLAMGVSDYLLKDSLNAAVLYKSLLYNLERNRYLLQIRESEQRYSDLFHLSPQPMWVYDLETYRFLDVNDAAVNHYGYSEEEFMEMTIRDIRPPEELSKLEEVVERSRERKRYYFQGEFLHQKKNGEQIIVDVRSNIINYQGRKAEIVLATDISERYRYIKAIEEKNKKLREIAWTQSHVVRAPLARIMGLMQLFDGNSIEASERDKVIQDIKESAGELDEIIQDIVLKSQRIETNQNEKNEPLNFNSR